LRGKTGELRLAFEIQHQSILDPTHRHRLQARALARPIDAMPVFKTKHRAVVSAHQDLAAVGAERLRTIIQRHRKMRASVDVHPDLFALAHSHQPAGVQLLLFGQPQGTTIGNIIQSA